MTAPIIHRARGPEALRDRAQRQAAREMAARLLRPLLAALEGRRPDFVIEVCRFVIRAMSKIIEAKGDAARALGVLSGAQADLTPAWEAERSDGRAVAEALFAERGAR